MTTYNKKEEEDEDAKDKYVVWCIGAWVTWPERPKGAKDKVKMPEGQKAGPKGRKLEVAGLFYCCWNSSATVWGHKA